MFKKVTLWGVILLCPQTAFSIWQDDNQRHIPTHYINYEDIEAPEIDLQQFQNMIGNVAQNLGMDAQEQREAIAALDDVTLAMFDEILQGINPIVIAENG